jgi:ABC-type uncharacterized transport system fused permease/ATPase subunit
MNYGISIKNTISWSIISYNGTCEWILILIEKESYFLNVLRYILQNALRLKLVNKSEEYKGSSLYYLLKNQNKINSYMYYDTIKEYFSGDDWKIDFIKWVNEE